MRFFNFFKDVLNLFLRPLFDLFLCMSVLLVYPRASVSNYIVYGWAVVAYLFISFISKQNLLSWRFFSFKKILWQQATICLSCLPFLIGPSSSLRDYLIHVTYFSFVTIGARSLRTVCYRAGIGQYSGMIAVLGSGPESINFAQSLSLQGYKIAGLIDDKDMGLTKDEFRVLGDLSYLKKLKHDEIIDFLVIPSSVDFYLRQSALQTCIDNDIAVKKISSNGKDSDGALTDFSLDELLCRNSTVGMFDLLDKKLEGKTIWVTGAGGSIGCEISRQLSRVKLKSLIVIDNSEYSLFNVFNDLFFDASCTVRPHLLDLKDKSLLDQAFQSNPPDYIFHAAAYKHVHMVEMNTSSALVNNVQSTKNLLELTSIYNVENFILVSTDKAVNPTSVMGATKRLCEILVAIQSMKEHKCRYSSVRFGNVLGSSGSLIPLLKKQIAQGGPVTITDPLMERFFMTIPEAVKLVLQSALLSSQGSINILKMGEPVKILDIAKRLIYLSGKTVNEIPIVFTGRKPGEKLYEELYLTGVENETIHPDIMSLPLGDCANYLMDEKGRLSLLEKIEMTLEMAKHGDRQMLVLLEELINSTNQKANSSNEFVVKFERQVG